MSKKAFTLIEIMIWILISSMIIVVWFQSFSYIMVWKVKLIESTNIEKESFSFMQKFFEEIKAWWLIDYEEYFNRAMINWNSSWNSLYSSWHFKKKSWFWNFWINGTWWTTSYWNWFYYCRSDGWKKMTGTWCIAEFNTTWASVFWTNQRYGQYSFHFIDYNSNFDNDWWDEDWDGSIIWDDDDEYLGKWPNVFDSWEDVVELYLISADKKRRTFFRWKVVDDPYIENSVASCDFTDPKSPTGSGCLGTIEFLKLDWKDWGFDHDISNSAKNWEYDWVVDTWLIDSDFSEFAGQTWNKIAWSDNIDYWIPLFPDSISVKSFDVRVYPHKNIKDAWREQWIDLSPYVRVSITLTPSWKIKKKIRWKVPEFNISTTINLTDIFSR